MAGNVKDCPDCLGELWDVKLNCLCVKCQTPKLEDVVWEEG